MIRPFARPAAIAPAPGSRWAMLAMVLMLATGGPLAAQGSPGGFSLPPSSPTPTPAPAGPADERAGIAIPPRAQPSARPTAAPTTAPTPTPAPAPVAAPTLPPATPSATPAPRAAASPASQSGASPAAAATPPALPPGDSTDPLGLPTAAPAPGPLPSIDGLDPAGSVPESAALPFALPAWWPYAAGGLGALVVLGAGAALWRRRRPKVLRLAAPLARGTGAGGTADPSEEPPRLDLTFEIISATRSVMMFTVDYRLTIANRSARAVGDLHAAAQLACARGSAGASAGAAQALETIARIGPHQARSLTGTLQLPLSAITPLRQGQTPLFIPLAHVTIEAERLPAHTRSFVIGTRSPSGRVHPIPLDQPPGGIAGLVAQTIAASVAPATPAAA